MMGFLRLDRPELQNDGRTMLVRGAPPPDLRAQRRESSHTPLAYLYETPPPHEPTEDLRLDAGHYDEANLIWSFTGEVTAIAGLSAPMTPESAAPGEQ